MKQSISKRIFVITFGLIIALMVAAALFQMFFFERFYTDKKTNLLVASVESFKDSYSGTTNRNAIISGLNNLQYSASAQAGIYSSNGLPMFGSDQSLDVTSSIFNSLISPDNISDIFSSGKTLSQVYDDKKHNIKHIVVITPMSINTKNDSILITVYSFQSIKEASSIIGQFYKYIFIALIFIGLILSFIYSDLISKPLKRLNKVARKMSSMDFTEKCIADREDEIGDLAKTLNFLSENLSNALTDLRTKNQKLQADIEKERKLEKIRKDFIAGVSHELKTPIGIIEGYAEGLKDNIVDGEAKDIYLDIIIDESNKMNKLVMDMLELSRLESDSNKLQIDTFDIIALTNEILFKYSNNFAEKNLKINKSYSDENIIMVIGDEFKIESVITNFITNAIKYTNENESINIFIGVDNTKALFSIENTGAFLQKDDLEKVWVQFYRVDKARSRSEGSSGLGLAIVKQMLTQHNSTFGVRNTANGVEFFFDLNLANSSTTEAE
ncbi:sensor histidine kinase [Clostridium fungisolvens]|uniref:histidine kinase n=1 Tax=Clostridium fungisolvens TaxID=1604897 RepID=A0A6V8SJA3_9CLOT|nr:HAMP domain-containing sensor histidine kinase [Clostridium fungisolvens]GFP76831.1 Adaptive-response sensory-kinase SasA [Clostridium fungisolvens]